MTIDNGRFIFDAVGSQWISVPHFNVHGNNKVDDERVELEDLFNDTKADTLQLLLDRYRMDFIVCGYIRTLNILTEILNNKL